jgi:hypothetical protein
MDDWSSSSENVRKDGTRALVLEPEDLLVQLCACMPPPWFHIPTPIARSLAGGRVGGVPSGSRGGSERLERRRQRRSAWESPIVRDTSVEGVMHSLFLDVPTPPRYGQEGANWRAFAWASGRGRSVL